MENVYILSLGFCSLDFVFYIPNLLSYIQNISSNELAGPVMGTIFLVILDTILPENVLLLVVLAVVCGLK